MKKYIITLIPFLTCIYVWCQSSPHKSCHPIIVSAIIYYSDEAPWGILRIATVEMHDFLSDTTNRGEIIIKNRDTLQFIRNRITHANAIASRLNIDTWIVALLYSHSSDTIDTLALNGYDYLQYNRTIFRDSILAYYLIDLIRSRSPVWDERAKNFYYDGKYNPLPKSFWNTVPDGR